MPSRPYFHGGEEFYLQDGALIAYVAPHSNVHGLRCHGIAKVLTTDRRYELGHGLFLDDNFIGCVWGDKRSDRRHGLRSLGSLIQACREVYGPRARYAIEPQEHHELATPRAAHDDHARAGRPPTGADPRDGGLRLLL